MSKFTCSFTYDMGEVMYDLVVKRVTTEAGSSTIVVSSNYDDKVKLTFAADKTKAIVAYLKILMRDHMEKSYGEYFECIKIKHIGGKMDLQVYPEYTYLHKREHACDEKHKYSQIIKTSKDDYAINGALSDYSKADKMYLESMQKHDEEIKLTRYPFFDRAVKVTSKIFKDLLVLMKDADHISKD